MYKFNLRKMMKKDKNDTEIETKSHSQFNFDFESETQSQPRFENFKSEQSLIEQIVKKSGDFLIERNLKNSGWSAGAQAMREYMQANNDELNRGV